MTQAPETGASHWASNDAEDAAARAALLRTIGDDLLQATTTLQPIAPVRQRVSYMTLDDAYLIQTQQLQAHLAAGRVLAGRKIGLTSPAMQEQLGVDSPDFGFFFEDMVNHDGDEVPERSFISPKIEPELAVLLKKPLSGPEVTLEQAREAVDVVFPALEIIDSRIQDWDITLVDTVADNASCGAVALGSQPLEVPLNSLHALDCELLIDGQTLASGTGEAVMGDPLEPLAWLANELGRRGETLRAGDIVLTGSFTKAVAVAAGQRVEVNFPGHGRLQLSIS